MAVDHDRVGLLDHQLAFVIIGLGDHRLVGLAAVEEPAAAAFVIEAVEFHQRLEHHPREVGAVAKPVGDEASAGGNRLGRQRREAAGERKVDGGSGERSGGGRDARGLGCGGIHPVGVGFVAEVRGHELRIRFQHVAGESQGLEPVVEQAIFGGDRHHSGRGHRLGRIPVEVGRDRAHAVAEDLLAESKQERPHP